MEIPINRDLRKFKTKDIGMFTFKEAGFVALALVIVYGVYAIQRWVFHIDEVSYELCALFAIPVLAFGFFKIKGLTLKQYLTTVFIENHLSPKIINWEKEGVKEERKEKK